MNLQKLSTAKLRAILSEIHMSGMGMKDILFMRQVEDELSERGVKL